jgi:hypothetical protein
MMDFDEENLFEYYVLRMLGKIILEEERQMGRMSGLRIFCRLDVSVYLDKAGGKHSFFVSEITRSHGAALFEAWDTRGLFDLFFTHMAQILYLVSSERLYLQPPSVPLD